MKKADLYTLRQGLNSTTFEHPRVTYAVNKNKRMVAEAISDMEKTKEPSKAWTEFNEKREKLAVEHAVKDSAGNPRTMDVKNPRTGDIQQVLDIPTQNDPNSLFSKGIKSLEKEYNGEIEKHNEKESRYWTEFINDETEFKPFKVPLELLEDHEKCPQQIMDEIHWMIEEPKMA